MLPMANIRVEHHLELNEADPVFMPETPETFSDEFRARTKKEVEALGGVQGIGKRLEPDAALVAEVIDFKDSEYARENGISSFTADDLAFDIDTMRLTGSLRVAGRASDALTLQYYEADGSDLAQAAFGHALTFEQWQSVARVKDMGIRTYFYLPTMSRQFARPLLSVMRDELSEDERIFTFLCGHDVNLATILPSLEIEEYTARDTIEEKTPIGTKLVIEKRIGEDGEAYASLKLVYQSAKQMQSRAPLTLEHPPVIIPLRLQGLQANEDGLYLFDDVVRRFDEAMVKADEVA
jgi:glucose-1-phosphatase